MKAIYEYRCINMHATEAMYPLGEAPDARDCDRCERPGVRLPSRGAFSTFAGSHNAEYRR